MTTQTKEAPILAEFAFRGAEEINPLGYMQTGDKGQDDVGNYTVADLAFKGYVKLWDNRTGRQILQPRWILWQTAQLKRPDGSTIFTDKDPHIQQNYGLDLVCLLNPGSPDYSVLQQLGFKPCYKKHTPTRVALNDHMKHSHKRAYAALEQHMTETRREEDRELQREAIRTNQAVLAALAGNLATQARPQAVGTPEAPLYVSDKPKTVRRRGPNRKK